LKQQVEWEANETYAEYKQKKYAGMQGMGQPNSKKRMAGNCPNSNIVKTKCKCRTCINRRNRSKGRRKQNLVKKKLKIQDNRFHGADAHEENWLSGLRFEVKAGKQVEPLNKLFNKAKLQSDTNHKAIGSLSKPFVYVAMPDGTENGIMAFQLDDAENVCYEILKNFGYIEED
tara:strand:+ start:153 stop:671 length:519 start_codon:yes stop_codon:yes gene_type:complete